MRAARRSGNRDRAAPLSYHRDGAYYFQCKTRADHAGRQKAEAESGKYSVFYLCAAFVYDGSVHPVLCKMADVTVEQLIVPDRDCQLFFILLLQISP